jgi:hypothetical protein
MLIECPRKVDIDCSDGDRGCERLTGGMSIPTSELQAGDATILYREQTPVSKRQQCTEGKVCQVR